LFFELFSSKKEIILINECIIFLFIFKRYYHFKKELSIWNPLTYPFPLEVEQIYDECVTDLRPKFVKAKAYAKACEQVENMEKEFLTLLSKKKRILQFYTKFFD
jgi:hypothetical protein